MQAPNTIDGRPPRAQAERGTQLAGSLLDTARRTLILAMRVLDRPDTRLAHAAAAHAVSAIDDAMAELAS